MLNRGVIHERLEEIHRNVAMLEELRGIPQEEFVREPPRRAEAIALMGAKGVLDQSFAQSIVSMGNFRNVLVHAYLHINRGIVYDCVQKVEDFCEFERQILRYLDTP